MSPAATQTTSPDFVPLHDKGGEWSLQSILRKACDLTDAIGAVLLTQVEGSSPCMESCHRVSYPVAQHITKLVKEGFIPLGAPSVFTMEIGVSSVACVTVSARLGQPNGARQQHAKLAVLLQEGHQISPHAVGRLEGLVAVLGLMLQRDGYAFLAGMATSCPVGVCSICDSVRSATGRWMRWDEFLTRKGGVSLSHTICPTCAVHHYSSLLNGT